MDNWRCPKMGVPQNHPKLDHFSIETNGFADPPLKNPAYTVSYTQLFDMVHGYYQWHLEKHRRCWRHGGGARTIGVARWS